jgi:ATP adenylyltransferase
LAGFEPRITSRLTPAARRVTNPLTRVSPENSGAKVTYEQLWAPWRMAYIDTAKDKPDDDGCFLCRYRDEQQDAENLVVLRGPQTFVVLNRFPYNNGHLLVAPLAHKANLTDLDDAELLGCMRHLRLMEKLYRRFLHPDGFNIGLNLGRAAGAGVPGHLHWHLVPRWSGDTSFMTVIDDVRVIPISLKAMFDALRAELQAEAG